MHNSTCYFRSPFTTRGSARPPPPLGKQRTVTVARHGELVRKPNPCTHFTLNQLPATRPQADVRFILLETAMGYLLFERKESDEIGATLPEVQAACKDYGKFSLVLKLKAQFFFRTAEEALLNINDVSEGIVTPGLKVTPQPAHTTLPTGYEPIPTRRRRSSSPTCRLARRARRPRWPWGSRSTVRARSYVPMLHAPPPVCPQHCAHPQVRPLSHAGQPLTHPAHALTGLGKAIQEQLNIACVCNDLTAELLRGARAHTTKFLSVLKPGDLEKARTYTCAHRADAMHVPCIAGRQPAVAGGAAAHGAGQGSCGARGRAALPPHPSHHTTPVPPASPRRHSWVSPTPTRAPRSSAAARHA